MMNVNISVALAVYNGEPYLYKQLESIVRQELLPIEIIIVDDGSSDNSENIIRSFDFGSIKCKYYKNDINLGPIANFKKAIGLCAGDFIALCDQDDIWLPVKLKRSYEAMATKDQSKPVVCFSDVSLIESDDTLIAHSIYDDMWQIKPENYPFKLILIDNVVIGCTALINRKMQTALSKMPTGGILMHDHWAALIGYSFGEYSFIKEPLMLYRSHPASVTQKYTTAGLLTRIKNEVRKSAIYMDGNFKQGKLFKQVHYNDLSTHDKKVLDRFLEICKWPFVFKRAYAKMLKLKAHKRI